MKFFRRVRHGAEGSGLIMVAVEIFCGFWVIQNYLLL